tara:strand:+ start:325 stop:813 length:489 start_codon:yes stop_codon:yes gene_type:complete
MKTVVKILAFHLSKGHDFRGNHGKSRKHNAILKPSEVECVTGKGIRGDRYFGFKENYKAQVTFFDQAVHLAVREKFSSDHPPEIYRRNILLSGVDLNTLIGKCFQLGEVKFEGVQECTPCYWMNQAVSPGTEEFLKGQGGLRARVLSNGKLRLGENSIWVLA